MATPLPNAPYSQPGQPLHAQKTNGFAIASLVLGILGITGLLGLIFGIIALVQIGDERGPTHGRSLAIAGLIVSFLWPSIVYAAIIFPVISGTREHARQVACMSNQKNIALQVQLYAEEHEESLPQTADSWASDIGVSGKVLICRNESGPISYGINGSLLGSRLCVVQNATSDIVLTADSQVHTMATFADLKKRHNQGTVASFLDGHVEFIKSSVIMIDPTLNVAAGAPNNIVLEGAGAIYSFDGTRMVGSGVTITAAAGSPVYFTIAIRGDINDSHVQNAVGGKTITFGLAYPAAGEKVLPAANLIGSNGTSYYTYAVIMPNGFSKMTIIPSDDIGILVISFGY